MAPRPIEELRSAAEQTPPDRERHVDLLRAWAITFVVFGHWLVAAVTEENGMLAESNALGEITWIRPLTWVFQVMPLFFLVGGYANTASIRSHHERGGRDIGWIVGRHERIVRPVNVFLASVVVAALLVRRFGADPEQTGRAVWAATVPLWFVVVYVVVLTLTPVAVRAHERWGLRVPIVVGAVALAADAARFRTGIEEVAFVNHLLVWFVIHQLGIAWRQGRIAATPRVGGIMMTGGLVAAVALVALGPYPVSMVAVPGADIDNTAPPSAALLALALAQCGLALALRDTIQQWLQRPRPWIVVVGVNSVILTIFAWHMAAAVMAAVALHGSGLVPITSIGSAAWWGWRIVWLMACAIVLTILVVVAARAERSTPPMGDPSPLGAVAAAASGIAVIGIVAGMLGIALAGPADHGPAGLPTATIASYGVGVLILMAVRRHAGHTPTR